MEAEDTVLVGCEVLCLTGDLISCPLSNGEQKKCRNRLQYEAGRKEVIDWGNEECWEHGDEYRTMLRKSLEEMNAEKPHFSRHLCGECWQAKLTEGKVD